MAQCLHRQKPWGVCQRPTDTDGHEADAAETICDHTERTATVPFLPDRHRRVAAQRQGGGVSEETFEKGGRMEGI